LMKIEERKNSVELYPGKVTIRRHGAMNAINVGLVGDKDIYLHTITGIQVKKPGLSTGYIQFVTSGSQDNKSGVTGATQDENSVIFSDIRSYERALAMKAKIEELIREQRTPPVVATVVAQPISIADELIKLAALVDQGILTRDEFDGDKRRLLGGHRDTNS
jgi:hypothetical protein